MTYIEVRNASLGLSRKIKPDTETAIYLCAATEAELAEQEIRCKASAKKLGLTVLAVFQKLVTDEKKNKRRALVRIFLRPIPFDVVIIDDLSQLTQ